jgi:SulP family sulfate permease
MAPLFRVPLLEQLGDYDRSTLRDDLIAGLTTAIMLVPQAMAYAMLAGLDPLIGLYASTVPLLVYGLLGTSRQLAVGPVAMVSLLVASAIAPLAGNDVVAYAGLAALLALMVGVMQWGMGVARLGFLVRFLSHPVIAGFTSAAALIIGLSQLGHVIGVKIPRSHHVYETVGRLIEALPSLHPTTFAIAAASLVFLTTAKRYAPKLPRFLIAVVAASLAVWLGGLDVQGVAIVGTIPQSLPSFVMPPLDMASFSAMIPAAITIALVGFMESFSVAKNFARQGRYEVDANQELVALGLANVFGSFLQAYPVTGGFSRTAVNAQAGARTGMASVITSIAIVITLLFLTPWLYFLPKAVLAAIILAAVAGLIDIKEAKHLWHVSRSDFWLMTVTFAATLTVGIEQGIALGVVTSLIWFIWQTSTPHLARLGRVQGTTVYRNVERFPDAELTDGVVALRLDAPLYFANTAFLKDAINDAILGEQTTHLVLDASGIGSVDAQALDTLGEIFHDLAQRDITVWLVRVRGPVRDALAASGLQARIGDEHVVERVHDAFMGIAGEQELAGPA